VTAVSPSIRILLPCPPRTKERAWGDYYFGHSLGEALGRLGCKVRYAYGYKRKRFLARWWTLLRRTVRLGEVELVIRGRREHRRLPHKRALMWLISQSDSLTDEELGGYDHVFVASPQFQRRISDRCNSSSVLLQCTDATRFSPGLAPGKGRVLFVGNRRDYAPRDIVAWAVEAGFDVEVWGKDWEGVVDDRALAGLHVENAELAEHYRAAGAVLNDHTQDMRANGFVSNRIYDVLACATPILTEDMAGIDPELRPYLYLYRSRDDVAGLLSRALSEPGTMQDARRKLAESIREKHSFDARARTILGLLSGRPAQAATQRDKSREVMPEGSSNPRTKECLQ